MTTTTPAAGAPRFIEELSIEGYGCIARQTFRLTPLHAFVGPNDSGKTTILQAVRTLLISGSSDRPDTALRYDQDPRFPTSGETKLTVRLSGHLLRWEVARALGDRVGKSYEIVERLVREAGQSESEVLEEPIAAAGEPSVLSDVSSSAIVRTRTNVKLHVGTLPPGSIAIIGVGELAGLLANGSVVRLDDLDREAHELAAWIAPPSLLRLDPDALREPSALIRGGMPVGFRNERGSGLPGVLEAIRDRDEARWGELRDRFLGMFPLVRQLHMPTITETQKSVEIALKTGQRIPAALMSEGMLYFLAFLAAAYGDRSPVLLVEEPENGLHPARIGEVMALLREVSKTAQILIATHSPLVLNELRGDEVTVVWRDAERGTQGKLLKDTVGYEKRSKVYAPGELWVSYANGIDEAPLREGTARK